jgi:hypothetical protein
MRSRTEPASNPLLTPEEDAIDDPEETTDEIDDTLPADLWFIDGRTRSPIDSPAGSRLVPGDRP